MSLIAAERATFHAALSSGDEPTLTFDRNGVPSIADGGSPTSVAIASHIAVALGAGVVDRRMNGQRAGAVFERRVSDFIGATFPKLGVLRPGRWTVIQVGETSGERLVSSYEPYSHLADLAAKVSADPTLQMFLGNTYEIQPDVLVVRDPEPDSFINKDALIVDTEFGTRAAIRSDGEGSHRRILHAVISCKWTLRSDRAQNARSELVNLIRNRKGRLPHAVVVTAEPLPSRLASLALGTGDIDCVYHFALHELVAGAEASGSEEAMNLLANMVDGRRLKDISDLPLDMCV